MKKFLNQPENYVKEFLEGIYLAHPDQVRYVGEDIHCCVTAQRKPGKVGLATGGGSGHLPLFLGFVGDNLLDGCAIGDVFQSPSTEQMLAVTREIDSGAGVLYIYGNYNGDIFNFDMAAEMADFEYNITVETVLGADDVSSGPRVPYGEKTTRRGVAGIFYVFKCAGAAAARGMNLAEVKRVADRAASRVATMGVGLTPCIVPRVGRPGFSIGDDEMEIGMGIHGETGIHRGPLRPADEVAGILLDSIIPELELARGDEVSVLINGLGATSLEELYILYRRAYQILADKGVGVVRPYVGEYATSMEMAGASVSIFKLDDELKSLLLMRAKSPFFAQA